MASRASMTEATPFDQKSGGGCSLSTGWESRGEATIGGVEPQVAFSAICGIHTKPMRNYCVPPQKKVSHQLVHAPKSTDLNVIFHKLPPPYWGGTSTPDRTRIPPTIKALATTLVGTIALFFFSTLTMSIR